MKFIGVVFLCAIIVGGCGSTKGNSAATEQREVLTAAEISTTSAQNAYEAISLKRPWFLQSRGPKSLPQFNPGQTYEYPVVYLDRIYYGELSSLRQIPVVQIKEIRFLDMSEATMQFGTGHSGGIILVLSRTR